MVGVLYRELHIIRKISEIISTNTRAGEHKQKVDLALMQDDYHPNDCEKEVEMSVITNNDDINKVPEKEKRLEVTIRVSINMETR